MSEIIVPTLKNIIDDWYGVCYGYYQPTSCKWYIGQTTMDLEVYCYKTYTSGKGKGRTHFNNAIKKYGIHSFKRVVLGFARSKEELDEMECYYIGFYDSIENGYNLREGGSSGKHSKETRQKLSNILTGHKRGNGQQNMDPEAKAVMLERLSLSHIGKNNRDNMTVAQIAEWDKNRNANIPRGEDHPNFGKPGPMSGKKHKPETIAKLVEIRNGPNNPNLGRIRSKEEKEKIRESVRKSWIIRKQKSKNGINYLPTLPDIIP